LEIWQHIQASVLAMQGLLALPDLLIAAISAVEVLSQMEGGGSEQSCSNDG